MTTTPHGTIIVQIVTPGGDKIVVDTGFENLGPLITRVNPLTAPTQLFPTIADTTVIPLWPGTAQHPPTQHKKRKRRNKPRIPAPFVYGALVTIAAVAFIGMGYYQHHVVQPYLSMFFGH